jgi:hypothetical protein
MTSSQTPVVDEVGKFWDFHQPVTSSLLKCPHGAILEWTCDQKSTSAAHDKAQTQGYTIYLGC